MFETSIETLEAPKKRRPYLEGLGIAEHGLFDPELDTETGEDLYIAEFFPDDIHLTRTLIEINVGRADAEGDISEAMIVADATLLRIMLQFFDAEGRKEGLESEDFHIHQDAGLRKYVKDCMRQAVEAELGVSVTDAWLDGRLARVQGFPPYSYVDLEDTGETGVEDDAPVSEETPRNIAALAIATTDSLQAA